MFQPRYSRVHFMDSWQVSVGPAVVAFAIIAYSLFAAYA
jgi:hypothetical protein